MEHVIHSSPNHSKNYSTSHLPQIPPLPLHHRSDWVHQSVHELEEIHPSVHELEENRTDVAIRPIHQPAPTASRSSPFMLPSTGHAWQSGVFPSSLVMPQRPQSNPRARDSLRSKTRDEREARRQQIEQQPVSQATPVHKTTAFTPTTQPNPMSTAAVATYQRDRVRASIPQHKALPQTPRQSTAPPSHPTTTFSQVSSFPFPHNAHKGHLRSRTLPTDLHLEPLTTRAEVLAPQTVGRREINDVSTNAAQMPLAAFLAWVRERYPPLYPAQPAHHRFYNEGTAGGKLRKPDRRLSSTLNAVLDDLAAAKNQHDPGAPYNLYIGTADDLLLSSTIFGALQRAEATLNSQLQEILWQQGNLNVQAFITWAVRKFKRGRMEPVWLLDETERLEQRVANVCDWFRIHACAVGDESVEALCVETVAHMLKSFLKRLAEEKAARARRRKEAFRRGCKKLVWAVGDGPAVPEKNAPLRSADRLTFEHLQPADLANPRRR